MRVVHLGAARMGPIQPSDCTRELVAPFLHIPRAGAVMDVPPP